MKISTEIGSASKLVGEKKAVEYVAKAGFDAYDLSMFSMVKMDWQKGELVSTEHAFNGANYLKEARELKKIAQDNGIFCNQAHAPFPVNTKVVRDLLCRALELSAEVGAKVCVIHPDNNKTAQENALMYKELLPFAKSVGVKIATENMWNWHGAYASKAACSHHLNFKEHIDAVSDDYFGACLDIGHAEMKGLNTSASEMIKTLGDSLIALHIHDNDLHNDLHLLPRKGEINFSAIIRALKEIDYKGEFTLEADAHLSKFTKENCLEGLKEMAREAKKLATAFENL